MDCACSAGCLIGRPPAVTFSCTPVGGRGPDDLAPGFDQQPIEAAAIADACARAMTISDDRRWEEGLRLAIGWFLGANDGGQPMFDAATGGGHDGLTTTGRNENQGAESTLALLATLQHAHRLGIEADAMSGNGSQLHALAVHSTADR